MISMTVWLSRKRLAYTPSPLRGDAGRPGPRFAPAGPLTRCRGFAPGIAPAAFFLPADGLWGRFAGIASLLGLQHDDDFNAGG
jgi:hypothetical protein